MDIETLKQTEGKIISRIVPTTSYDRGEEYIVSFKIVFTDGKTVEIFRDYTFSGYGKLAVS